MSLSEMNVIQEAWVCSPGEKKASTVRLSVRGKHVHLGKTLSRPGTINIDSRNSEREGGAAAEAEVSQAQAALWNRNLF